MRNQTIAVRDVLLENSILIPGRDRGYSLPPPRLNQLWIYSASCPVCTDIWENPRDTRAQELDRDRG